MTLRAFLIGLIAVVALCLVEPYTSFNKGWGYLSSEHFPAGAVFVLVVLTLAANALIKIMRRSAAFDRAELMLVWIMLLVASAVPSDGLMSFWPSMMAGPAYLARRPDIQWRETSLAAAPEGLLVTKDPKSLAVEQFYEGRGVEARVPWSHWLPPALRWMVFLTFFYLSVIFVCAVLRRQWVDVERLQFPLARVPLEFTEGSAGPGLLPSIFANRAFLFGFFGAAGFRLLRALPSLLGGDAAWQIAVPLRTVFQGTALENAWFADFTLWWMPIGFAYLVPADVSLSIWFFYLFGRFELLACHWTGSTLGRGTWSPLMRWQQCGAYLVFAAGTLYMARRHLAQVFRKGIGRGPDVDDSAEPIPYKLSVWGFTFCTILAVAWFVWYGMSVWIAALLFVLFLVIQVVHARMVAQSGLYTTWFIWEPPDFLHSLAAGHAFSGAGAVVASMTRRIILHRALLGPASMDAFRISEVFARRKRLLLAIMVATLFVAIGVSFWSTLHWNYRDGAVNWVSPWRSTGNAQQAFESAHMLLKRPEQGAVEWVPFGLGVVLTGAVMFMRARFYWWPIHSIGILAMSNWSADRIWLPFLLGWLVKQALLKFGSGRALRQGRFFFIGLVLAEGFMSCVSTIVRTATGGTFGGL